MSFKFIGLRNPIRKFYHFTRAVVAQYAAGFPSRDMIVIGVTGTKWKTTTTNLITQWLIDAGESVAMFSTLRTYLGGVWETNNTKMTSADPFTLVRFLKQAQDLGVKYLVLEVSSHAIYYQRIWGIDFDVAAVTNISQDHLDLHGTMEHYIRTKLRLFKSLVYARRKTWVRKVSVVNLDMQEADRFTGEVSDAVMTYGIRADNAQIRAKNITYRERGVDFTIRMPSVSLPISSKLRWEYNIENMLCAVTVLVSQGISTESIKKTLENFEPLDGRMEEVENDRGLEIYIDYAHTEASLESVLHTLHVYKKPDTQLIVLFGATGDRDRDKRPKMGKVVDRYADCIILTEDDNYTEDPLQIISEVAAGIPRKEWEDFWVIFHRYDAIRTALTRAQPGDIILLAGKWAENVMVTNQGSIEWNDRKVVEEILAEMDKSDIKK